MHLVYRIKQIVALQIFKKKWIIYMVIKIHLNKIFFKCYYCFKKCSLLNNTTRKRIFFFLNIKSVWDINCRENLYYIYIYIIRLTCFLIHRRHAVIVYKCAVPMNSFYFLLYYTIRRFFLFLFFCRPRAINS